MLARTQKKETVQCPQSTQTSQALRLLSLKDGASHVKCGRISTSNVTYNRIYVYNKFKIPAKKKKGAGRNHGALVDIYEVMTFPLAKDVPVTCVSLLKK